MPSLEVLDFMTQKRRGSKDKSLFTKPSHNRNQLSQVREEQSFYSVSQEGSKDSNT
jgi:hypothetical protein